ncbi:hypothetical protein CPB97_008516 [Podila verticillata]|nr:hypothetical protein CPB97_008516 [Podila verticillata]
MSPPTPFAIPHILKAITDSFSFTDLLSCVLVNHAWYDALIGVLWLDVVTYRSKKKISYARWEHEHYFRTPEGRQGLIKNAQHVRGLTCRDPATLQLLSEIEFTNLVEINFVAEWSQQHKGLEDFTRLVARCPNLRAVSVEGLYFREGKGVQQLKDFVAFLADYPSIRCLFLGGDSMSPNSLTQGLWEMILEHRLAKVDYHQIVSLSLMNQDMFNRSSRGLPSYRKGKERKCGVQHPQQYQWPRRETHLTMEMPDPDFKRHRLVKGESYGRWEFEVREPQYPTRALAVLEHNGVLVISLPTELQNDVYMETLLRRFPNLQHLGSHANYIPTFSSMLMGLLPKIMYPNLQELELNVVDESELDLFLSDPHIKLSYIHIGYIERRQHGTRPFLLDKYFHRQHHYLHSALTTIGFGRCDLKMAQLLSVLNICPNLHMVHAPTVNIDGITEPEVSPPWACRLQELTLVICLEGHTSDRRRYLPENQPEEIPVRSLMSAEMLAPSFMKELGLQTGLRTLDLSFNRALDCRPSPFLRLDLEAETNGLRQLNKLKRLESFTISGLLHQVGNAEVAWMKAHWPRLSWIELPVLEGFPHGELAHPDDCHECIPDYSCFPDIRVQLPYAMYVCSMCEMCPCEDAR